VALNSREAEQLLRRKPYAEWTVPLPETTDFKSHRMFVVPPMDRPGFYMVVASARKNFSKNDNQMQAVRSTSATWFLFFGRKEPRFTLRAACKGPRASLCPG